METALFIGRFQPFHQGHLHAIVAAQKRYRLVVGIGSSNVHHTKDNPLPTELRKHMIRNCFPDLSIQAIPDFDDNDEWYDYLRQHVAFDTCISGNDLVHTIFQDHGAPVEHPDLLRPDYYNGTRIRDRIRTGKEWRHLVPDCSQQVIEQHQADQLIITTGE